MKRRMPLTMVDCVRWVKRDESASEGQSLYTEDWKKGGGSGGAGAASSLTPVRRPDLFRETYQAQYSLPALAPLARLA